MLLNKNKKLLKNYLNLVTGVFFCLAVYYADLGLILVVNLAPF